jgi:hypothetical protein
MTKPGNIRRVVLGEPLGTLVLDERRDPRLGRPRERCKFVCRREKAW